MPVIFFAGMARSNRWEAYVYCHFAAKAPKSIRKIVTGL